MRFRVLLYHFILIPCLIQAQEWQLISPTTVVMRGECTADNDCLGPLPSPIMDQFFANAFVPGGLGYDWAVTRGTGVQENTAPLTCQFNATWAESEIFARAIIDGDNSDLLTIYYGVTSECFAGLDIDYLADGHVTLQMTVTLDIVNAPPGFPVIIDYSWDHFGGFGGPSEAVNEDDGFSRGAITLTGAGDLLQGQFDFASPPNGVLGFNKLINQSDTLNRHVGDQIQLTFDLAVDAQVAPPHPTPPMVARQDLDRSTGSQWGKITLSLGTPIVNTPPDSLYAAWLEYSVDIGGDAELSDPASDGNEVYDPGDAYPWGLTLPPGGSPGIFDDAVLFAGVDPFPSTPDLGIPPLTRAPVGSGLHPSAVSDFYFDLDGLDYLDFDLSMFAYGPGQPSIGYVQSPCIFSGEYLFVSFDDDAASHYTAPLNVPLDSWSPWNSDTYGTFARRDEVTGLFVSQIPPTYPVFQYPYAAEGEISLNMTPDPDLLEDHDDDVDALDIRDGQCGTAYFTVDHEAKSALHAGLIYMAVAGGGYIAVIDSNDLGITGTTDVDAMEFAWLYDANQGRIGLALLFSVDDNDPLTLPDESGGLNPRMIYASFLNGSSFPYLSSPLIEDVDAISCWSTLLFSQYSPPPSPCLPPDSVTIMYDPNGDFITLRFYAHTDGVYEIHSTTSTTGDYPGPDWMLETTITALQGMNAWDQVLGAQYKRYIVRRICP